MFPRLFAFICMIAVGTGVGTALVTAKAQETRIPGSAEIVTLKKGSVEKVGNDTVTLPPAITVEFKSYTVISLPNYRKAIWNQLHWTNRALRNRCRSTFNIDEFTKTPLKSVSPSWRNEHIHWAKQRHHRAQDRSNICVPTTVSGSIEYVFGPYATEAHRVASCESGHSTTAVNGQYVGVFQMGEWERRSYGWYTTASSAYTQVKSAWNYFADTGKDWSPWSCKP